MVILGRVDSSGHTFAHEGSVVLLPPAVHRETQARGDVLRTGLDAAARDDAVAVPPGGRPLDPRLHRAVGLEGYVQPVVLAVGGPAVGVEGVELGAVSAKAAMAPVVMAAVRTIRRVARTVLPRDS
jgi:hypothetical protein